MAETVDGAETVFTWDLALAIPQVLATSDGTKNLYRLDRIGAEQGGAWWYSLPDALGSVRQWTDPAGGVLGVQSYGPYGEPLTGLGPALTAWGYTGEWQDPTGLVYLRARWYNGTLGRFTQVDPFPGLPNAPATLHPYIYVLNDPLNGGDPSGEIWPWLTGLPGLAVSVVVGAAVGAIGGGISYAIANPGHSLSEYAHDPAFRRSVGSGAVGGAVAGLVSWALPIPTTFWGAVGTGAVSGFFGGGTARLTENLLTPGANWREGVPEAALLGGVLGGAFSGAWYGASRWVGRWWAGRGLPQQWHHYASNISKRFTPRFRAIAGRYGLSLEDVWNIGKLPHCGRHADRYHEFVLRQMERAAIEAGNDVQRFLRLFD